MRSRIYVLFLVLFLVLFAFAFISCSSGTNDNVVFVAKDPEGSVAIKSVNFATSEKSDSYDTYIYIVDYQFETKEEVVASVTLCMNQGAKGVVPEKKIFSYEEYTNFEFEKSMCTSEELPINPTTGKITMPFNLLNTIMDISSRQQIFGDVKVFTFVNDAVSAVHYLGDFKLDTIPPYIFADNLTYEEVVASGLWSVANNTKPEYINVPVAAMLTLSGSGADNITVTAEGINNAVASELKIADYDGKALPPIRFTLENIAFTPTRIQSDLKNENQKVVDHVDMSVIATTDDQHLPYIGMTFTVRMPYADLEQYIPSLNGDNTVAASKLSPVEAIIPVSFTAKITLPDGKTTLVDTDSFEINIVDVIYDTGDMWRTLYNAEMYNGVDQLEKAAPAAQTFANNADDEEVKDPAIFSPVKYESQFFHESGNRSSFYGNIKFVTGVYTETTPDAQNYQLRAQADGNSIVSALGQSFDVFDAFIFVKGLPKQEGTDDKSTIEFGYGLEIFKKKVISDTMTAEGRFKFEKTFTFEKEFASQGTIVVIVPFYYDVGGRGAVGVTPTVEAELLTKNVQVPKLIGTFIPNPEPKPKELPCEPLKSVMVFNPEIVIPWYVRKDMVNAEGIEKARVVQRDYTFVYEDLPQSAKDFLISKNLVNIVTYEDFFSKKPIKALHSNVGRQLRREWGSRETNNINARDWRPGSYRVTQDPTPLTKVAIGVDVKFKAKPYIEMDGYGKGGFGVAKDWYLLKFSVGVGVEAKAEPLVYADIMPEVLAFIGIAGKVTDPGVEDSNQLLLTLNYKAPFTYLLIKGKIWAGIHLNAAIKFFGWRNIVDGKWGRTLLDNKGIGGTYEIVKPFNQMWVFTLPDNKQ